MAKKEQQTKEVEVVLRGDLKQRDVTALELELARMAGNYLIAPRSSSRFAAYLKAAIGAGWIKQPECEKREVVVKGEKRTEYVFNGENVDDSDPRVIYRAGYAVAELYDGFTTLDPN